MSLHVDLSTVPENNEFEHILRAPVSNRTCMHAWPLSLVEEIQMLDGQKYILKTQLLSCASAERAFYEMVDMRDLYSAAPDSLHSPASFQCKCLYNAIKNLRVPKHPEVILYAYLLLPDAQRPHCIDDCDYHDANICKDGHPHARNSDRPKDQAYEFNRQSKCNVFPHDFQRIR